MLSLLHAFRTRAQRTQSQISPQQPEEPNVGICHLPHFDRSIFLYVQKIQTQRRATKGVLDRDEVAPSKKRNKI